MKFPSLFVSHGSPMLAVEPGRTGVLLQKIGQALPKPKAILMVSAHWTTGSPKIVASPIPRIIHDFGGFPQKLYELDYPANGDVSLAKRVIDLLADQGVAVQEDYTWGLDHGAWVPLRYVYPDADVPVVQLSLQSKQSPAYQYQMGQLLAPLAAEGILIMGSGSFTHNLREIQMTKSDESAPYTLEFLHWFLEHMQMGDLDALLDYRARAPYAKEAHPYNEHLLPLFVMMGACDDWMKFAHLDSGATYGVLRMDAFAFGNASSLLSDIATIN